MLHQRLIAVGERDHPAQVPEPDERLVGGEDRTRPGNETKRASAPRDRSRDRPREEKRREERYNGKTEEDQRAKADVPQRPLDRRMHQKQGGRGEDGAGSEAAQK
jgi:hypothetical protein